MQILYANVESQFTGNAKSFAGRYKSCVCVRACVWVLGRGLRGTALWYNNMAFLAAREGLSKHPMVHWLDECVHMGCLSFSRNVRVREGSRHEQDAYPEQL